MGEFGKGAGNMYCSREESSQRDEKGGASEIIQKYNVLWS